MPARGRMQLVCSALLGALAITCAASPSASPAPRAEQEQRGGEQAEQPPVEQQQPAQPPVVVLQPPVVAQPGPASQGGGGVAQVPNPGSEPRRPTGGQRRPSGNAPGVRHEIPAVKNKSDLAQSDDWKQQMMNACADVGVRDSDCPTFDIQVFSKDKAGKEIGIKNPGPNYGDGDSPQYTACTVTSMNPRSPQDGGPKLVSPGTVIKVKVVCTPDDTAQNNTEGQQSGVQQDKTNPQSGSANTSEQQPNTGNGKITEHDGSGQAGPSQQQSVKKQGKKSTENGSDE
jgi:hypothetical protein